MNELTSLTGSTPMIYLLILALAYSLVLFPASFMIKRLLRPWIDQINASQTPSLVNAGAMIGCLERLLMLTFILLGEFTAVGFVLGLKAAYRFKDTGEHTHAEYMLMGTFLSLTITLAVGLGAEGLIRLLVH